MHSVQKFNGESVKKKPQKQTRLVENPITIWLKKQNFWFFWFSLIFRHWVNRELSQASTHFKVLKKTAGNVFLFLLILGENGLFQRTSLLFGRWWYFKLSNNGRGMIIFLEKKYCQELHLVKKHCKSCYDLDQKIYQIITATCKKWVVF